MSVFFFISIIIIFLHTVHFFITFIIKAAIEKIPKRVLLGRRAEESA